MVNTYMGRKAIAGCLEGKPCWYGLGACGPEYSGGWGTAKLGAHLALCGAGILEGTIIKDKCDCFKSS